MTTVFGHYRAWAAGFRAKVLLAMMIIVSLVTILTLFVVQRHMESEDRQSLQRQFQKEINFQLGAQQEKLSTIAERCRTLAKSVRIRAALENGAIGDLYTNAEGEMRDLIKDKSDIRTGSPRAEFYRFLNDKGEILTPPTTKGRTKSAAWEKQLAALEINPVEQQVGYLAAVNNEGEDVVYQIISTPIVATNAYDVIGAVVLGFLPGQFLGNRDREDIKTGIWMEDRLHMSGIDAKSDEALGRIVGQRIRIASARENSFQVEVGGEPYLLFFELLNPDSKFPPAYQTCLYPLKASIVEQRALRWNIIGSGVLVLLCGFLASHFLSGRLSKPMERLAEHSAANIVQREQAEAALEVSEQNYRSIFENAVEGIFIISADGKFRSVNPAVARIFGYDSPAQFLAEVTDPEQMLYVNPEQFGELLKAATEEEAVANFECEAVKRDGSRLWITQNLRVMSDSGGGVRHIEGTVVDITGRKRAADELLALNAELQAALSSLQATQQQIVQQERLRALGQMASGIAHDFNNALVPILGFCELLMVSPDLLGDKKKLLSYLDPIQTAARDATNVVARLREFYRVDKGDRPFGPVNLKRLVEQSVTLTKPKWKEQAQAAGAMIHIVVEPGAVPPVAGDESALREVLTNLIFNAVDAMPEGGTLTIRTRAERDRAVIEVEDTGTGMSQETREHCLDPFFSTKGDKGTGLGLSMVFGIVKRHSGMLDIRSQLGRGTRFIITLPLQDDSVEHAAVVETHAPHRRLRVLFVDDDAPVRSTLSAILNADGHEVTLANNGAEGLRAFVTGKFDLVITDKSMPVMNGDQMAAAIKKTSTTTPIILLSGFGLFHQKADFPDVDALVSKPVRIQALREAIASVFPKA